MRWFITKKHLVCLIGLLAMAEPLHATLLADLEHIIVDLLLSGLELRSGLLDRPIIKIELNRDLDRLQELGLRSKLRVHLRDTELSLDLDSQLRISERRASLFLQRSADLRGRETEARPERLLHLSSDVLAYARSVGDNVNDDYTTDFVAGSHRQVISTLPRENDGLAGRRCRHIDRSILRVIEDVRPVPIPVLRLHALTERLVRKVQRTTKAQSAEIDLVVCSLKILEVGFNQLNEDGYLSKGRCAMISCTAVHESITSGIVM